MKFLSLKPQVKVNESFSPGNLRSRERVEETASRHLSGTTDPEGHRDLLPSPVSLLAPCVFHDLARALGSLIGATISFREA